MPTATHPRQEELLAELTRLFLAEGFARFTLAELAAHLRCSKSTLYALGHSKEALTVAIVRRFFRDATAAVEAATAQQARPADRLTAYLRTVADELRPAGETFMRDVAAHPATREIYERNTAAAAERVREIIAAGADAGAFRDVDARFVADLAAAYMARIQSGEASDRTGLSHAEAYDELNRLLLLGVTR